MGRTRILIVDDQPRARQGLTALLATCPQEVGEIREAESGEQAISLIEAFPPDVVLMDARMPGMDGLEATRCIKARWPQIQVIILSMYLEYAADALAAGAEAFVSKGASPEQLLRTIELATGHGKPNQ